MPVAGPKALASCSLLLTQRCENELLHLCIVLPKDASSHPDNQVWKINFILSEEGMPFK